eukprot:jgi/Psemu1/42248/gm1.42248_g
MVAVATDVLDLAKLPMEARGCHKFNRVLFGGSLVTVTDTSGSTVLAGHKDPRKKLFMVPLYQQPGGANPTRVVPRDPRLRTSITTFV